MKAGATRTEAEDAAQEAMIQAWRHWNELTEPKNNPRGWVRKVAMRVFLKTVPKRLSCGEALPMAVEEVVVDLSERTQLVLRLFASLPYMSRMVLAYTADGFTDEETAAELNTTPAAVRKSRQRGRQTMKELLRGGEL
jgi:RNA polymerase sigma-70 factor (ECF subfamily)